MSVTTRSTMQLTRERIVAFAQDSREVSPADPLRRHLWRVSTPGCKPQRWAFPPLRTLVFQRQCNSIAFRRWKRRFEIQAAELTPSPHASLT